MTTITITAPTEVAYERIEDLLCNAFEGGSNYWLDSILCEEAPAPSSYKKETPYGVILEGGRIILLRYEDGKAIINLDSLTKGLELMAKDYPWHFQNFVQESDDAETGDVFLQLAAFGEVIYG